MKESITIKLRSGGESTMYMDWNLFRVNEVWMKYLEKRCSYNEAIEQINKIMEKQNLEQLVVKVKELRVKIDGMINLVNNIHHPHANKSALSLELGKNWLGKVLQYIGNDTPYVSDGNRHTIKDIEPTADVAEPKIFNFPIIEVLDETPEVKARYEADGYEYVGGFRPMNMIEQIDYTRQRIKEVTLEIEELDKETKMPNREAAAARTNAWSAISESGMNLGDALRKIKESHDVISKL